MLFSPHFFNESFSPPPLWEQVLPDLLPVHFCTLSLPQCPHTVGLNEMVGGCLGVGGWLGGGIWGMGGGNDVFY